MWVSNGIKPGSSQPKTARTGENVTHLKLLISENRTFDFNASPLDQILS